MTSHKRDPIKKNHKVNAVHNKRRLYPDSRVELTPFAEKYYDIELDIATFGLYKPLIKRQSNQYIFNLKIKSLILDAAQDATLA